VVERSPEKAGVGGSTPSLATIIFNHLLTFIQVLHEAKERRIVGGAAVSSARQVSPIPAAIRHLRPIHLPQSAAFRLNLRSRPEIVTLRLGICFSSGPSIPKTFAKLLLISEFAYWKLFLQAADSASVSVSEFLCGQ
jgi:hypothetical protein